MRLCFVVIFAILVASALSADLDDVAAKLVGGLQRPLFGLRTQDTRETMDCFKLYQGNPQNRFGVFHTSTNTYSKLSYTESGNLESFASTQILSDRGSQGTVYPHPRVGFFIAYELENSEGNTIAIRYYQSQEDLKRSYFVYEYQLERVIGGNRVRNVGTPSVDAVGGLGQRGLKEAMGFHSSRPDLQVDGRFYIDIRFHFSPDGQHDYPGLGRIYMNPAQDFVDSQGHWVGGCKPNHKWSGNEDKQVLSLFRNIGCEGKIGQRDGFKVAGRQYYLYECNYDSNFDWRNWRIILYDSFSRSALFLPLYIGGAVDFANPHITLLQKSQSSYQFLISLFLPSQGITPGIEAKAGEVLVRSAFTYP